MKKIVFASVILAALALGMGSCGKGDVTEETDTTMSSVSVDSMTTAYGELTGAFLGRQIAMSAKYDSIFVEKEDFLNGLHIALSQERSDDFVAGMNAGIQIGEDLKRLKAQGAVLDRATIVRLIDKYVMGDTVSEKELSKMQRTMTKYSEQLEKKVQKRNEIDACNSPQGVANNNAGKNYAKAFMANPDAKKTESGLLAVVENVGTAAIDMTKPLLVNITLKHVNGEVFASQENYIMMPEGQLPGITEALGLLGIGGKGSFVLPPELGYGVLGMQQAGVGPMEWLMVDLEVVKNVEPEQVPNSRPIQTQ